jgi:hypothetical protein
LVHDSGVVKKRAKPRSGGKRLAPAAGEGGAAAGEEGYGSEEEQPQPAASQDGMRQTGRHVLMPNSQAGGKRPAPAAGDGEVAAGEEGSDGEQHLSQPAASQGAKHQNGRYVLTLRKLCELTPEADNESVRLGVGRSHFP